MIILKNLGVTLLVLLMFFYEYPRFRPENKKEKAAFTVLASAGWALAIALMWFPRLPGPTEFINYVTKPIWNIFYPEG
ncbi:hypothetical protein NYE48_15170 [Paenibacillus sp. FSL M7-1455]|jgi:multisubunit Na+/H+ antiporter MnhB subunit|uniref:hypothetical protein n=1 Tax=Paenibacillus sp. FSL M7-1455 TaxID=2975316 RepID=UPI0030F794CF